MFDKDVTKYYKDVLPRVPGHYWKVEYIPSSYSDSFSLTVRLWTRWKIAIVASDYYKISPSHLSHGNVKEIVATSADKIAQLMELVPKPRGGFFISFMSVTNYSDWFASVKHPSKKVEGADYRFYLEREDHEDLEYKFKTMLDTVTTVPSIPGYITGK